MKRTIACLFLCFTLLACTGGEVTAQPPETEDQKILYTIGQLLSRNLAALDLSEEELAWVQQGMTDGLSGEEAQVDVQEYGPKVNGFAQARSVAAAEKEKVASTEFVAAEAAKDSTTQTESGVVLETLTEGTGASPTASDTVRVHYHGTLRDGTVFDSSVDRGTPAEFSLSQVIPCWTEAVQTMKVGGKSRVVCPSDLAYGDQGRPGLPGGAALIFEVELLEILTADAPAPAATDGGAGGQDGNGVF